MILILLELLLSSPSLHYSSVLFGYNICLISSRNVTKPYLLEFFVQNLLQLIQIRIYQFIPCLLVVLVIALIVFAHYYTYPRITYCHQYFLMYLILHPSRILPTGYLHLLIQIISVYLPLMTQICHLMFIYVLSPFSSMIKHFAFMYIIQLLIHRFPFLNQHLLQKILFLVSDLVLYFKILYISLMFAFLARRRT